MRVGPLVLPVLVVKAAFGQFSFPGCPDLNIADFSKKTLMSQAMEGEFKEPMRLKIDERGRLFIALRVSGQIWMLDPANGYRKRIIGTIPVVADWHNGLVGLALAPDFSSSGYLYTVGTDGAVRNGPHVFTVSRYKMVGDTLDSSSGKTIIRWTAGYNAYHLGSDLFLTKENILYIPTGNDAFHGTDNSTNEKDSLQNSLRTSLNTNDLRGKVLRIRLLPLPDSHPAASWGNGITYSIPTGNLYPPGTPKTRPEIYAMGLRNPFTIHVDGDRLHIADVGPQGTTSNPIFVSGGDQLYVSRTPANHGWPMFVDGFRPNSIMDSGFSKPVGLYDADLPINTSRFNTGRDTLPPPRRAAAVSHHESALNTPGWFKYKGQITLIAGPVYHYDRYSGPQKFPPHFDGKWFVAEFMQDEMKSVALDGESVTDIRDVFTNHAFHSPIDMEFGPDGRLYVLEYSGYLSSNGNTSVSQISYSGTCLPVSIYQPDGEIRGWEKARSLRMDGQMVRIPSGMKGVRIFDLNGMLSREVRARSGSPIQLPIPEKPGVRFIRFY